jgi:2-C-methyl-D-erythritol 4-phosphate cytidylyltransferase
MKKFAVLVAGGSGSRMNSAVPKQFLLLKGKPVLYYTIHTFLQADADMQLILVLPQDHLTAGQELINNYFPSASIQIIAGGDTRFQSVKNGLTLVEPDSIVFVHDAVRCLLSVQLIQHCGEAVKTKGAVVPAIPSKDSVRMVEANLNRSVDRNSIQLVQTPQVFLSNILLPAFNVSYQPSFTDEASVVELTGTPIYLIEGEEKNIKITHPTDLILAEYLLQQAT